MIAGRLGQGDCSLSMAESSPSEGWQRKKNFKEDSEEPIQAEVRIHVAREGAEQRMDHRVKKIAANGVQDLTTMSQTHSLEIMMETTRS